MMQIPTTTVTLPVVNVPVQTFTMPYALSYEFQVAEHLDTNDKITKVALQMKVNQHDQYGNIMVHGTWNDVPRVQIKF